MFSLEASEVISARFNKRATKLVLVTVATIIVISAILCSFATFVHNHNLSVKDRLQKFETSGKVTHTTIVYPNHPNITGPVFVDVFVNSTIGSIFANYSCVCSPKCFCDSKTPRSIPGVASIFSRRANGYFVGPAVTLWVINNKVATSVDKPYNYIVLLNIVCAACIGLLWYVFVGFITIQTRLFEYTGVNNTEAITNWLFSGKRPSNWLCFWFSILPGILCVGIWVFIVTWANTSVNDSA